MPKFSEGQLKQCFIKDNATLVEINVTYTRNTIFQFICSCGNIGLKSGRRIVDNGALCEKCTQTRGCERGKTTRNSGITEDDKQKQLIEQHNNTIISDREKEIIKWRDNLILEHPPPEPNTWYSHPLFTYIEANINGEVRNKIRNKIIKGSSLNDGRTTISINKSKKQKHRIIMECIYNCVIPDYYDIDHIINNPGNNLFSNLQIVTRKEHCYKTAIDNPESRTKAMANFMVPVKYIEYDKKTRAIIKETEYPSINHASRAVGVGGGPIRRSLCGKLDINGNQWEYITSNEIQITGEIWKEYPTIPSILVSNKGRIKSTINNKPIQTFGSKSGEYKTIQHLNVVYKIHNLVCLLFNGEKPSTTHTVDHKDRNSLNNCSENLCWATKKEQSNNRSCVKPIEVYDLFTQKTVEICSNQKECCDKYNILPSVVSSVVRADMLLNRFNLGFKHKNLSVRFLQLTKQQKIQRELTILNHEIKLIYVDKNKRKTNPENLPLHLYRQSSNSFRLVITFRNIKFITTRNTIDELIIVKEKWIDEQKTYWTNIIINTINNSETETSDSELDETDTKDDKENDFILHV